MTRINSWMRIMGFVLLALAIASCAPSRGGEAHQPVPRLEARVTDVANTLLAADRERIIEMLANYERETSHQIGVLVIPTLTGESIESFSLRVANSWRLGRKDLNDGILITLAMQERKVRIDVGTGMEEFISDETAKSIIETSMAPAFRKGDFAGGLQLGLERLMQEARRFVVAPAARPDANRT